MDIYLRLAALASAPDWQLPVYYQLGMVFERLNQPEKATEYYANILRREKELAGAGPGLQALVEMARWRKGFIAWRVKTETANLQLHSILGAAAPPPGPAATAKPIPPKAPPL